jgi:chondroitin-sulfate-ABC endolyase/exolyase
MLFLSRAKLFFIFIFVAQAAVYAQNRPAVESFEDEAVLSTYKAQNSNLSASEVHYRYGEKSLKWTWTGEAKFSTSNFRLLTKKESPLAYGDHFPASPTLQLHFYNESPQNQKITFSFKKNGQKEVWFDVILNFKGWRTIWVPFYEMKGNAPKKGASIDYDTFQVSTMSKSGTLFFDDIIFSQYQDDRHQYPDEIVPFVKEGQDLAKDHWMPLISNYERVKNVQPKPISVATRMDLKKFEQKIDANQTIPSRYKVYINTLKDLFAGLNLRAKEGRIIGPPLTFKRERQESYFNKEQQGNPVYNDIYDFGKVMKKLSNFHGRAKEEEKRAIEEMLIIGAKYFLDQGWAAGSNGGTRHHVGYNVRDITEAFFNCRKLLYSEGLLNEIASSLHWLFNIGMLLEDESKFHVNIDYLNTQSYYHLMLIFMFEKQEMQAAMLSAYSKYISITLAQQKEEWGFKIDGTAWHHNGHYPAYGIGAFNNVPKVINTLARTRFRIRTEGHENFKKAFLASRIYSQKFNWGFGSSGRHPLENNGIQKMKDRFLWMANAGDPTGKSKIDKEVAAAYLRLWGKEDIFNSSLFTEMNGIQQEDVSGYYTFPYASLAVHRRDNWAAFIKGYSKYVWASEIYVASNRYGRYQSNGSIQLVNEKGEKGSGFQQKGWNWNRYPGTTVIDLPLKELEPKMPLIMFRSGETFAGTVKLGGNGVFGMILNEGKGSNADGREVNVGFSGKLKAKKSVFSFGDKLICIGTNISSIDDKNPTQTNLFQTFLEDKKEKLYTSIGEVKKFSVKGEIPKSTGHKNWIIDNYGNGYHMLSNDIVHYQKEHQKSYHNKYSINTGKMNPKGKGAKETVGNFASAWIDHGLAPKNASYQYVIYPFHNEDEIKDFGEKVKNDKSYTILKANETAHIVKDKKTNTTAYVVFEADTDLENGILKSVSKPALVMARKEDANSTTISIVQPDLNFEPKGSNRFINFSRPVKFTITLDGKWSTALTEKVLSVDHDIKGTVISLELKDGLSHEIALMKQ